MGNEQEDEGEGEGEVDGNATTVVGFESVSNGKRTWGQGARERRRTSCENDGTC